MLALGLVTVLPFALAGPLAVKRADSPAGPFQIHPFGNTSLCLSVMNPGDSSSWVEYPGPPAAARTMLCPSHSIAPYSPRQHTQWTLGVDGDNQNVQLFGWDLCLDAGTDINNNGSVTVQPCSGPGAPQQQWNFTQDDHLAITGGTQCLDTGGRDVTVGVIHDTLTQTYECGDGPVTDQIFSISPSQDLPTTNGTRLHLNGDPTRCLTVAAGYAADGTVVSVTECFADDDPLAWVQIWNLTRNAPTQIKLAHAPYGPSYGDYCLEFENYGNNSHSDGVAATWSCTNDTGHAQTFLYTEDNQIQLYQGTQCLDLDGPGNGLSGEFVVYNTTRQWQCTNGTNPNQTWTSTIPL